ncbi:acyl-CoA synthetase [Marinigracilibium pacificum]|uniref:AMP-binding protein n=1 Tax=Marinigracilibium pacificum TaxID=2729599 RepID=A0A848ISP4_9BACT|nr:acyl-CoA synthetase [Marinigracilibium pacificum]NMM47463.1 AMP-binding protein [Marinigracilibium pacificum]
MSLLIDDILKNEDVALSGDNPLTYEDLKLLSSKVAAFLLTEYGDLNGAPVLSFIRPSSEYVISMLGTWLAGGMFVPMPVNYPISELEHYIKDSGAYVLLTTTKDLDPQIAESAPTMALGFIDRIVIDDKLKVVDFPQVSESQNALMIYTSGTTGKPKGVVHTCFSLKSQIDTLIDAWGWSKEDKIINPLPMHHVHGIVNITLCALTIGAQVEFMKFDKKRMFDKIVQSDCTLFMAVPTIYRKLIDEYDSRAEDDKEAFSNACKSMRLMVSGSAALPLSVLNEWMEISGHFLLERYGMSETGMVLSNSYTQERFEGMVGKPLPGLEVRINPEDNENNIGELQVRGNQLFKEYWNKPEETEKSFTDDGWFKTGDRVEVNNEGVYKILGRYSVDIIKIGGYKVSAREIEDVLRNHEFVSDLAVVGIPHRELGETAAAAVVFHEKYNTDEYLSSLKDYAELHLARQKVPTVWVRMENLPQNAMGKVVKPEVKRVLIDALS